MAMAYNLCQSQLCKPYSGLKIKSRANFSERKPSRVQIQTKKPCMRWNILYSDQANSPTACSFHGDTTASMTPVAMSSIKVGKIDDVQELRKAKSKIPGRFVRDKTERPTLATESSTTDIPIIDFFKLSKRDKDGFLSELLKLSTTCEEWGFFQVINHGIDQSLLEQMEKVSEDFFMLPLAEKQKYPMAPGTVQGYGQAFVFSEDQKLDWCNMFALGIEPKYIRNRELWPTNPSNFSETVEVYSREVRKLCRGLLKYIALSLDLRSYVFNNMFGVAVQAIRMNYYPACPKPELVLGISPHSDGTALTVLQERKGSPVGLQILKDNKWISVQPIPNALVINIGDTLEVLTNGRYKSVEHRAVTHKEKDRLSIVTFYAPKANLEIGPMPEMVDENNPCKYRTYNHGDYTQYYLSNKLEGKKSLDFAKIDQINSN